MAIEKKPFWDAVNNLPAMFYNWYVAPAAVAIARSLCRDSRSEEELHDLEEKIYNFVSPSRLSGSNLYR